MLENSQNCLANLIFKKVQKASENVLTGTFLPPGSGLATPGLQGNDTIEWNAGCKKIFKDFTDGEIQRLCLIEYADIGKFHWPRGIEKSFQKNYEIEKEDPLKKATSLVVSNYPKWRPK